MGRARPANRRQTPAPPVAAIAPPVVQPTLPAAPQPDSTPVAAGLDHSFARMSVLPAPHRAGAGGGGTDLGDQKQAVAPPAISFLGRALPVQRDGEANPSGTPQPTAQPLPAELQLVDPTVIRPALSQINLMAPLTLPQPIVAPPAGAPQAGLPPVPNLTLTQPTIGAPAGGQSPPLFGPGSPPTLTPPGAPVPAGAGPAVPRAASAGDMFSAIIAVPVFDTAIKQLQINAQQKIVTDWKGLNTGEKVGVVSALGVIALGSLGGAMTNPESRQLVLGQINGKVLPVPGLPWLSAEFMVSDDNLGFGLHLDVGRLVPSSWGFGKASITPFGGPPIQRAADEAPPADGPTTAEAIRAASGAGQPLDGATRARLEPGLGADLGAVRVHDDARADGLARGVQARAFTSGQDIFFRHGTYAPASQAGMHLVAHEVAHTVQQGAGPVAGTPTADGLSVSDPADPFERAAVGFADRLVAGDAGRAGVSGTQQGQPTAQIMRAPETSTPVPPSTRSAISDAVETIHNALTPGPGATDISAQRERMLSEILLHADQATELKNTYRSTHNRDLIDHVQERYGGEDALRADEYLNKGRLRAVAKLLLAIDGVGTKDETVWRVLPDVQSEGKAEESWKDLVSRPLEITKRWSSYTLDAALKDDFSGGELDKALALVRHGKLRDIDKIRVGTNQIGTDEALVFEGLGEADRSTVRARYKEAYQEDLDELLFGKVSADGEVLAEGELSGEDLARAQVLLGTASNDPDRLVQIVGTAVNGLGTNTALIWEEVGNAVKQSKSINPVESKAAADQLARLKAKVEDPGDPLGLKGLFGDLGDADYARLRAMLGIAETSTNVPGGDTLTVEILNDPMVRQLRSLGGVDVDTAREALMKADRPTTQSFVPAWAVKGSPLREYLIHDTLENSDLERGLNTILQGSLYERLRFCAGGFWRDDQEEYASNLVKNHTNPEQRLELRKALQAIDSGQAPTDEAGTTMAALHKAFSSTEMGQLRGFLQQDDLKPGERDPVNVTDRAAELEGNIGREGSDEETADERREMRAAITVASLDGKLTPEEEARIRASENRVAGALKTYVQVREEYVNYASQAVSIAVGILVTAASGGAAGPAVMAAIMRAAIATAMARVVTEKVLKGDRFDLAGADGARAFLAGAVDGALNVAGGAIAARAMGAVAGDAVQAALQKGTATLGTRLAASAIEGGVSGAASGTVDSITNEDTWRGAAVDDLTNVFNAAITSAAQGAAIAVGVAGVHAAGVHVFTAVHENALKLKVQETIKAQAIKTTTFADAVKLNLETESAGLADVVKGMSPEVRNLYEIAYNGMNNPANWEAVVIDIARETQNLQVAQNAPGYKSSNPEITTPQSQAVWNLSERAAVPGQPPTATTPQTDFFKERTPFGPRFFDAGIGREHGMSAHMVQDLVVDRAFQQASVGMKAEQFRARMGTEIGPVAGSAADRSILLWNALYDSSSGFTSPDTVTPFLKATLGAID